MTPEPIHLGPGEDFYCAGDLPSKGWECKVLMSSEWRTPGFYSPDRVVIARRKKVLIQVGDRVRLGMTPRRGTVIATVGDRAWVEVDREWAGKWAGTRDHVYSTEYLERVPDGA